MQRPVDALVTGFTKSPDLLARSLAPIRRLKHEGLIRNIHCVTWDTAELDACVAPLADLPEIQLTRVAQPNVTGSPNQRGVVYQVENLKAALALTSHDALILKWRPDFVARHGFLREKIVNFPQYSIVPARQCLGVTMPAPVFGNKVWIPWADSNSPFFFEDAVFLGARRDVEKLAVSPSSSDLALLGHPHCGAYAHIFRYARPFLAAYPLLKGYVNSIRYFRHELDYRHVSVPYFLGNGFFWYVLIAHAWILHSQFHVDIGEQADLKFYANAANRDADWSDVSSLRNTTPYDTSAGWRTGTKAGMALPSMSRAYGRLMDDDWQRALFTTGVLDLPREMLASLMANVAGCPDGRLNEIEADFYREFDRIYRAFQPTALAG